MDSTSNYPTEKTNPLSKVMNRAMLSVLASVLLWSTSYVITKIAMNSVPPFTFGAVRFCFASAVIVILSLTFRRVEPVTFKDFLTLAVGGLLGITAYFALQNLGVQRTSAAEATLLVASYPAITMLLEILFKKSRFNPARFMGIGVAFVGVYLVINQSGSFKVAHHLQGNLFLLACGLVWALYNFATQNVVQKYSTFTVIFWQTLVGSAAFLPLTLFEPGGWHQLTAGSLWSALFLGVFCSILAFLFYGYGLKGLDPGSAVSLLNLVPVFGLILAVIVLKEQITAVQVLGGVIVLVGVALSTKPKAK